MYSNLHIFGNVKNISLNSKSRKNINVKLEEDRATLGTDYLKNYVGNVYVFNVFVSSYLVLTEI